MNKFKITAVFFFVFVVRAMQPEKFRKRNILSRVNRRTKRESLSTGKFYKFIFALIIYYT